MSETTELVPISEGFLSGLSARERVLVLVFTLLFALGGVYYFMSKIVAEKDLAIEQIDELSATLAELKAVEPDFIRAKATKDAYEKLLKSNNIDLPTIIDKHAKEQDISIEDYKEKNRVIGNGEYGDKNKKVLKAYTQQVRIKPTGLKELSIFLSALEKERVPVRVTRIDIRPSRADRQKLSSINLSVTTYKKERNQ